MMTLTTSHTNTTCPSVCSQDALSKLCCGQLSCCLETPKQRTCLRMIKVCHDELVGQMLAQQQRNCNALSHLPKCNRLCMCSAAWHVKPLLPYCPPNLLKSELVLTLFPTWRVAPLLSLGSAVPQAHGAADLSACLPLCLSEASAEPRSACDVCQRAPAWVAIFCNHQQRQLCSNFDVGALCCTSTVCCL